MGTGPSHMAGRKVPMVGAIPELRQKRACKLQRVGLKAARIGQCWQP